MNTGGSSDRSRHFVLAACATYVEIDHNEDGVAIEDSRESGN